MKRNILRVIPFGLIWLLFSFVYTVVEKGLLANLPVYPSTGNPYNFTVNLFVTPFAAFLTGLLTGIIEIKYFHRLFLQRSFGAKILYKSITYLLIIVFFLLLLSVIANANALHVPVFTKLVWENVGAFAASFSFWSVVFYVATILVITQFFTEVSENLGQQVLFNFFTGKYHQPSEEDRIFMFLDMKSSTTIAESLGHVRYFDMLREYYADLSDSVIDHLGQIYQYVGDEMVLTWKLQDSLHNNHCIDCFFSMKEALLGKSDHYQQNYGWVPQFKAGLHVGRVTTGEIGVIKKEIIFTGDVLNTAARIQSLCNTYETDILVSGELINILNLPPSFTIAELGETELKGRDRKTTLFTIQLP